MLRSIEIATLQDCLRDKLSDCPIVTYFISHCGYHSNGVHDRALHHVFAFVFRSQCLYGQLQLTYVENLRQGPLRSLYVLNFLEVMCVRNFGRVMPVQVFLLQYSVQYYSDAAYVIA